MFARASPQTSFVSLRFTNIIKREKWAELPNQVPGAWERTLLMLSYTHEDDVLDVHYKALEADISGGLDARQKVASKLIDCPEKARNPS